MSRHVEYAWFDVNLFDHPKIVALLDEQDGEKLLSEWFRLILWARRLADPAHLETAGVITPSMGRHQLGADRLEPVMDALCRHRLADALLDGTWLLHNFCEHQHLSGWAAKQARNARGGQARGDQLIAQAKAAVERSHQLVDDAAAYAKPRLKPRVQPALEPRLERSPKLQHTTTHISQNTCSPLARFGEFYELYPRHVARVTAERTWAKVTGDTDPEVIIAGARRYAELCERKGTETRFIAYPATWLNAGRWNDDYDEDPAYRTAPWERR